MPSIPELSPSFQAYLTLELGRKELTVTAYKSDLKKLDEFLAGKPVEQITVDDIRAYIRHLRESGDKFRTIERRRAAFSTFWRWLKIEHIVTENPIEAVTLSKRPRAMPKWLEETDLRKFAQTPDGSRYAHGRKRNQLAWKLLAVMGLRRSELRNLRVSHVLLQDALLLIRESKGDRERVLPIPEVLRDSLAEFTQGRIADEYLLTGIKGERWNIKSLTDEFKRHVERCGLPTWVTPHTIRHSYATLLVRRGVPIFDVQKLLGHRDTKTTLIYLHISPDHLRQAAEKHVLS